MNGCSFSITVSRNWKNENNLVGMMLSNRKNFHTNVHSCFKHGKIEETLNGEVK